MQPSNPRISVSVVSHGQGVLLKGLLDDLDRHASLGLEVIVTVNVPETLPFKAADYQFPIQVLTNRTPKGFGANHNAAFRSASGNYFCVLNPDIRLPTNPFPELIRCLVNDESSGVAAPSICNPWGTIEDSARRFPTPLSVLRRVFNRVLGIAARSEHVVDSPVRYPDWVAGMFLLFDRDSFAQVHGFDEAYFLYYEDVDICARLRLAGQRALLCPSIVVVHHARRDSHRNFRFFRWHAKSLFRYLTSPVFLKIVVLRQGAQWGPTALREGRRAMSKRQAVVWRELN